MIRFAQIGMILIFVLSIVFHLLVLTGVIPFEIVWGGRLKSEAQMLPFELVSIAINLIFLFFILAGAGYVRLKISGRFLRFVFWIMFALFLLNTLGNLLSDNTLERIIFTPVTAILSVFSFILARKSIGSVNTQSNPD